MRTVAWLRNELTKFPEDAVCFAYEGEVTGIIIAFDEKPVRPQGVIYCSDSDDSGKESELLPNSPSSQPTTQRPGDGREEETCTTKKP
jgi:hypothetical protein